mmetsp:Transcript_30964/g.49989  ORF Transcript_30964/g.49989 Transcript_30964/m.49989 type:complete len:254 (-) Transcript_30964:820-1581(-)
MAFSWRASPCTLAMRSLPTRVLAAFKSCTNATSSSADASILTSGCNRAFLCVCGVSLQKTEATTAKIANNMRTNTPRGELASRMITPLLLVGSGGGDLVFLDTHALCSARSVVLRANSSSNFVWRVLGKHASRSPALAECWREVYCAWNLRAATLLTSDCFGLCRGASGIGVDSRVRGGVQDRDFPINAQMWGARGRIECAAVMPDESTQRPRACSVPMSSPVALATLSNHVSDALPDEGGDFVLLDELGARR